VSWLRAASSRAIECRDGNACRHRGKEKKWGATLMACVSSVCLSLSRARACSLGTLQKLRSRRRSRTREGLETLGVCVFAHRSRLCRGRSNGSNAAGGVGEEAL
jgi:hypothetical protein